MPVYIKGDYNFTLAAGRTATYFYTWENIPGQGPNKGPVLVAADPESRQKDEIKLVTFDPKKCRRGPQNTGFTEVFYEFSVRNESVIDARFDVEFIVFDDLR